MRPLESTTIGSFPLPPGSVNVARCARLQAEAGIDYPAVPQLEDFCLMFLKRMSGLRVEEGRVELEDVVEAVGTEELRGLTEEAIRALEGFDVKGVKSQVTGPITLGSLIKVGDKTLVHYPDLLETLTDAVCVMVRETCAMSEVKVVFVDEPMIPGALWSGVPVEVVLEHVNKVLGEIRRLCKTPGVHVCGDVVGYSGVLLKLDAAILHHEFKATPKNFNAYTRRELERHGKMLGVGCVENRPTDTEVRVESVEEIEEVIARAAKLYGADRIIVAPDCGFAPLRDVLGPDEAVKVIKEKLRRMVEAARRVKERYLGV